ILGFREMPVESKWATCFRRLIIGLPRDWQGAAKAWQPGPRLASLNTPSRRKCQADPPTRAARDAVWEGAPSLYTGQFTIAGACNLLRDGLHSKCGSSKTRIAAM